MADLIDREAAMDALAKLVPYAIFDVATESYTNGLMDAYNLICQLPYAQPERIKSKWRYYEGMYTCENCNATLDDESPFCPMCGADMR